VTTISDYLAAHMYLDLWVLILGWVTMIYRRQRSISSDIERDLAHLHARRLARIRTALSIDADLDWNAPAVQRFPFDTWIKLTETGIDVAGQSFKTSQCFAVTARDERNVPRASISCDGHTVLIESHGQKFRARLRDGQWSVELLPPLS
jgi:hypothetical protein